MNTRPNVIFLDMDGVLCNERACLAVGNLPPYSYLDPIACLLVARLCKVHNARLVVSSSWRQEYSERVLMEAILNAACPNLGSYLWVSHQWWRTTAAAPMDEDWQTTSSRGREIRNWIERHPDKFTNFCILDDMADMRPYQDSLVQCHPYDGIGWHQYHAAAALLSVVTQPYLSEEEPCSN